MTTAHKCLLALIIAIFAAPSIASADPKAHVKKVCDHLAAHATDYEDDDKAQCQEELLSVFTEIPEDKQAPFIQCVTAQKPISKDAFGECFVGALGDTPPPGTPLSAAVTAESEKVCKHLTDNATDFDKSDAEECVQNLGEIARMASEEKFKVFTGCILSIPKPAEKDMEVCFKSSKIFDTPPGQDIAPQKTIEPAPVAAPENSK